MGLSQSVLRSQATRQIYSRQRSSAGISKVEQTCAANRTLRAAPMALTSLSACVALKPPQGNARETNCTVNLKQGLALTCEVSLLSHQHRARHRSVTRIQQGISTLLGHQHQAKHVNCM